MRTTLQIDDDVLEAARSLARSEDRTLGEVISALARSGLRPTHREATRSGFPVFDVSGKASPITAEMVRKAMDQDAP